MSRDLITVYDGMQDPLAFIKQMGQSIAKSQFFSCANIEQGEVLAMECMARRIPPLTLAERYHMIHGKLSMKSDTMLAELVRHGGTYKMVARSADSASVWIKNSRGDEQTFSLAWGEALAEPFVYAGKESSVVEALASGKTDKLKIKDKYATPRSRMQMLWARVVSDGVRAMCPEAIAGSYAPEEVGDFDDMPENGSGHAEATAPVDPLDVVRQQAAMQQQNGDDAGNTIDAEYTVADSNHSNGESVATMNAATTSHPTPEAANGSGNGGTNGNGDHPTGPGGYATNEQSSRMSELLAAIGPKSLVAKEKFLTHYGVKELRYLKHEDAEATIKKLESFVAKRQQKQAETSTPTPETGNVASGESQADQAANESSVDGPCSQVQVETIRRLIDEIEPHDADIQTKIATKISPRKKIAELSHAEAAKIQQGLEKKARSLVVDATLDADQSNTTEEPDSGK